MILVNLRPQSSPPRPILRRRRTWSAGAVLVAALVGRQYLGGAVVEQAHLLEVAQAEVVQAGREVAEATSLTAERSRLVVRAREQGEVRAGLRGDACLLRHLAALVPAGIELQDVHRSGGRLVLVGAARSDRDVVELLRALSQSPWVSAPPLVDIGRSGDDPDRSEFTLDVAIG